MSTKWSHPQKLTLDHTKILPVDPGVYEIGYLDERNKKFKPMYIGRAIGSNAYRQQKLGPSLRSRLCAHAKGQFNSLMGQYIKNTDELYFRWAQVETPARTMAKMLDFWGNGKSGKYEWNSISSANKRLTEDEKHEEGDAITLLEE